MSQQKDMVRRADIGTTASYGGAPLEELRPQVKAVAKLQTKLRPNRRPRP